MAGPPFSVRIANLADEQTRSLIALHLAGMAGNSPPDAVFALDAAGLDRPDTELWGVYDGPTLIAIGAIKLLGIGQAELKSMRTHPDHLRRGAAAALLDALVARASELRIVRLSLETGTGPAFEPALSLYRARGFRSGPAFGDYPATDFNQFLHLNL